jgi:hypothetical protein
VWEEGFRLWRNTSAIKELASKQLVTNFAVLLPFI